MMATNTINSGNVHFTIFATTLKRQPLFKNFILPLNMSYENLFLVNILKKDHNE